MWQQETSATILKQTSLAPDQRWSGCDFWIWNIEQMKGETHLESQLVEGLTPAHVLIIAVPP